MEKRLRFSVRNALLATCWFAMLCGNWAYYRRNTGDDFSPIAGYACLFNFGLFPAAFVGAVTGRQWHGIACGIASGTIFSLVVATSFW